MADGYRGAGDRVRDAGSADGAVLWHAGLAHRPTIPGRTMFPGGGMPPAARYQTPTNKRLNFERDQEAAVGSVRHQLAVRRPPGGMEVPDAKPAKSARRSGFWKEPPAEPAVAESGGEKSLHAVRLTDKVLLLLPLARTPDEFDLEAARAAAGPLLKLLVTPKLIDG